MSVSSIPARICANNWYFIWSCVPGLPSNYPESKVSVPFNTSYLKVQESGFGDGYFPPPLPPPFWGGMDGYTLYPPVFFAINMHYHVSNL